MPRTQLTIAEKLAKDRVLLQELTHRITHFHEVERVWLYQTYFPEYADREAPRLLQNLKNRRYRVTQRIQEYEVMIMKEESLQV